MATAKRRLIPGGIELHPTECALVVQYSIVEPNQQDPTPATKTIALKSLSPTTNLASLASEVAAKCKLIHPNKVPKVEQLLALLVQRHAAPQQPPPAPRKPTSSSTASSVGSASTAATSSSRQSPRVGAGGNAMGSNVSVAESAFDGRWDMTDDDMTPPPTSSSSPTPSLPPATLDQLDTYLDLLYEDLPAKLESTRSLLSLSLTPSNLPHLAANDSLLPALARTLREDTKRSMHLSATILAVMHQFARHDAFRALLKANKVGDLCVRQLEMEVHRTRVLAADGKAASVRGRQDAVIYEAASVLVQLADEEDGSKGVQAKMVKRGIVGVLVALLEDTGRHPAVVLLLLQFLASLTRFKESVAGLLAAGDAATAALIDSLVGYASPAAGGAGCGVVQAEALKVLLNLSHDAEWRAEMMRLNLVARLAAALKDASGSDEDQEEWVPEVLLVMYQLSCDERSRAVFTYTDAMPIVRKMVLKLPLDQPPSVELMTLAINLALNEHNAEQFAEQGGLKTLVKRLARTRDYLVLKLVRNLSLHAALHLMFVDHLDDLVSTFLTPASPPDLLVELFGTLANLRHPSLNFSHLLLTYPSLLPLITSTLTALKPSDTLTLTPSGSPRPATRGASSDDLALESIHLLTTLALDADTAPLLAAANVPGALLGVMRAREDDDEMVLQVLLAFSHLLMLDATREAVLPARPANANGEGAGSGAGGGGGGLVAYLIDLMYDRNAAIRAACMRCLDVVCDLAEEMDVRHDESQGEGEGQEQKPGGGAGGAVAAWAELIRTERFHFHNAEWLAAMASAAATAGGSKAQLPRVAAQWHENQDEDDNDDDLSIAIREGKRSPKHLDHDDGGEHHAADMYGHVKLVYA